VGPKTLHLMSDVIFMSSCGQVIRSFYESRTLCWPALELMFVFRRQDKLESTTKTPRTLGFMTTSPPLFISYVTGAQEWGNSTKAHIHQIIQVELVWSQKLLLFPIINFTQLNKRERYSAWLCLKAANYLQPDLLGVGGRRSRRTGFDSWHGQDIFLYPTESRPVPKLTKPPVQWIAGIFWS
jgi:hypothetical protein